MYKTGFMGRVASLNEVELYSSEAVYFMWLDTVQLAIFEYKNV